MSIHLAFLQALVHLYHHLSSLSISGFITNPFRVLPNNFHLPSLSIDTMQLLSLPVNTMHHSFIFFQRISSICQFVSILPARWIHHLSLKSIYPSSHQQTSSILFHHTIHSLLIPTKSNYYSSPTSTTHHFQLMQPKHPSNFTNTFH